MRWFETPNYNFTSYRYLGYLVSGFFIVLAILTISIRGLEYGIDFTGGKQFVLEFQTQPDITAIKQNLTQSLGKAPEVKTFGSPTEVLVLVDSDKATNHLQDLIGQSTQQLYPGDEIRFIKTDVVGPSFAHDLKASAIQAILFSVAVIFIYILIRFKQWTFSVGAILALAHDVLITLGIVVLLQGFMPFSLEINQPMIAAFLTIVGYSINDTVVVFDRIRENLNKYKSETYETLINKSINETLSRTTITSLTTIFVVTVLFLFGGESLKSFTFSLLIGLIVGTYSSVVIASNIALELHERYYKKELQR